MTLDDDSILSAYLDGQLGPEQQQAVESALFADPRLAEELRGLAALRDLLAGLPREAPADVTSRVMRRVRRRALRGDVVRAIAWGPVRAAVAVAIAASLMVLALPWLLDPGRHRPVGQGPAPAIAQEGSAKAKARPILSEKNWPSFSNHGPRDANRERVESGRPRPVPVDLAAGEGPARGDLMHVREYLDNPQLRRIFLVSEREDGSAEQRVASVVEQTTRFNFYRITVSQGIVIDPRHPDRATVFALVVGPHELDDLRHRLRTAMDDRVEESPVEPGVVTHLADIGHVEACPPLPAAEMEIPNDALALRAGEAAEAPAAEAPPQPVEKKKDLLPPTPEQERSRPNADLARASGTPAAAARHGEAVAAAPSAPAGPPPTREAEPTFVVLIWVTRDRPG